MIPNRIAIISKNEISDWKSCQHIVGNLIGSYSKFLNEKETLFLTVPAIFSNFHAFTLANELRSKNVEMIIWIDHRPCGATLLRALFEVYSDIDFKLRPKLLIHLFGDFVLDCLEWKGAQMALANWPIHFITASEKQKKLVEAFFFSKKVNVTSIPFAVDNNFFNYDKSERVRNAFRQSFNFKDDEIVILYTGRISYQKNIEILVKIFNSLKKIVPSKINLLFAGEWDDILLPYTGKFGPLGSHFAQFHGAVGDLPISEIHFLGKLDTVQLNEAYNGSDLFISLSTYNDEDYGMSPAEALNCGLPVILSNWGGYSSFKYDQASVDLVPVVFDTTRPLVNIEIARKLIFKKILECPKSKDIRAKISMAAQEYCSVSHVSQKLKMTIENVSFSPVEEFSNEFLKLCAFNEINPGSPFKKGKKLEFSDFYEVVYGRYGS